LHDDLTRAGIHSSLIIDREHVEPPHFDGSPILTALGVGPLSRDQAKPFLSRFRLWRGPKVRGRK
jgi:hypothetical protein